MWAVKYWGYCSGWQAVYCLSLISTPIEVWCVSSASSFFQYVWLANPLAFYSTCSCGTSIDTHHDISTARGISPPPALYKNRTEVLDIYRSRQRRSNYCHPRDCEFLAVSSNRGSSLRRLSSYKTFVSGISQRQARTYMPAIAALAVVVPLTWTLAYWYSSRQNGGGKGRYQLVDEQNLQQDCAQLEHT